MLDTNARLYVSIATVDERRDEEEVADAEHGVDQACRPHPAILTVVVVPHSAIESSRSSTATVTMLRRTAVPTADADARRAAARLEAAAGSGSG